MCINFVLSISQKQLNNKENDYLHQMQINK